MAMNEKQQNMQKIDKTVATKKIELTKKKVAS